MEHSGDVFGFRSYLCHRRDGSNAVGQYWGRSITVANFQAITWSQLKRIFRSLSHGSSNASRLRDDLHNYKTFITLSTLPFKRQASLNKKLILLPNQAHGGGYGPQTLEFQYDQLSPGTMSSSGSYGVTSATVLLVSTPFQQCLDQHP
jgi:hypothetical protein